MNNKNTFTGDKLSHAIKIALSGVVCSLLFVLPVHAVEFNVDMIDVEDRENIDISRFEKKGYITPGKYLVRVQINKNMLPQTLILVDLPLYFQTSVITYPITSPLPQIFPWRAITQRTMRMPFVIMLERLCKVLCCR